MGYTLTKFYEVSIPYPAGAYCWDGDYLWVVMRSSVFSITSVAVYSFNGELLTELDYLELPHSSSTFHSVISKCGEYMLAVFPDYMYTLKYNSSTSTIELYGELNNSDIDTPTYIYSDTNKTIVQFDSNDSKIVDIDISGAISVVGTVSVYNAMCKVSGTTMYLAGATSASITVRNSSLGVLSTYTFPATNAPNNLCYIADIGDGYFWAVWKSDIGSSTERSYVEVLKLTDTTLTRVAIQELSYTTPTNGYTPNGAVYDGSVLFVHHIYSSSTATGYCFKFNKVDEAIVTLKAIETTGYSIDQQNSSIRVVLAKGVYLYALLSTKIGAIRLLPSATFSASKLFANAGDTITFTPT